jgi:hypothetical protein
MTAQRAPRGHGDERAAFLMGSSGAAVGRFMVARSPGGRKAGLPGTVLS